MVDLRISRNNRFAPVQHPLSDLLFIRPIAAAVYHTFLTSSGFLYFIGVLKFTHKMNIIHLCYLATICHVLGET